MSLILDALRKIELERKARRSGGIELRPEVLSYRGTPQNASPGKRIVLVGGVLLLTGFGAVALLWSEKRPVVAKVADPAPVRATAPELPATPPPLRESLPSLPARVKTDPDLPLAVAKPGPQSPGEATGGGGGDNIIVSGIAWQEERVLRRAVINGLLLAEGAEVLGAKILEIKENRVRFTRSGQVFEVLYPSPAGR